MYMVMIKEDHQSANFAENEEDVFYAVKTFYT